MKIANASVHVCSPGRNFVTLKIQTDEGIYGLGDATLNGREMAVASYLTDHVVPCLIGRDPFQTEDIWKSRWSSEPYLRHTPKLFQKICETFSDNVHLLHDCHHRLTPIEAARLGKELEPFHPLLDGGPYAR